VVVEDGIELIRDVVGDAVEALGGEIFELGGDQLLEGFLELLVVVTVEDLLDGLLEGLVQNLEEARGGGEG